MPKTKHLKTQQVYEKTEQDLELEGFLFGTVEESPAETSGFFIDESGDHDDDKKESDNYIWKDHHDDIKVGLQSKNRLKKLRTDFDEDLIGGAEYEQRLRSQFQKINPTPNWAAVPDDEIVVDELFQTAGSLVQKSVPSINPDRLRMTRVADANKIEPSNVIHYLKSASYKFWHSILWHQC